MGAGTFLGGCRRRDTGGGQGQLEELQGQHGAEVFTFLPCMGKEVIQLLWCRSRHHLLGLDLPTTPQFCFLAGGGVMGAAGRNAAQVALEDFRHL